MISHSEASEVSDQRWLVIRCGSCGQCSGQRRQHGRCPHCGSKLDGTSEVVKECPSSAELHLEVGLANTPEALRDELRSRLSKAAPPGDSREVSPRALLKELRSLADGDDTIDRSTVQQHLEKKDIETPVDGLMEQAEVEGVVLRLANGRWMFFE